MSQGARIAEASGSGLGKLILCGEHAVVHGHPAIAFAVDLQTRVTLRRDDGATHVVDDGGTDPRLTEAIELALPETGWEVQIASTLPVGRGMGSSAALAVALARARAAHEGRQLDPDEVFARAMPLERVFHGNPSGLDVAVSARGGAIRYRRGPPPHIEPLTTRAAWRVVVLDTGRLGNTAELVAGVSAQRPGIDPVLARIGTLVTEAAGCLDRPGDLGPLLVENHRLLARIGVSTPELDALVVLALDAGAWGAKLSGAGGGGVVMALVDDPAPLLRAAGARGVAALECRLAPAVS